MTLAQASGISAADRATATAFPPPPEAALTTIGSPVSRAKAATGATSAAGPLIAGSRGAPARRATRRAESLSPSKPIAAGGGPIQVSPASSTAWANAALSDRNPYPGCSASAPEFAAARSTLPVSR